MENKPTPAEDSGQRSTSSAAGLNRDVHRRAFHLHKRRSDVHFCLKTLFWLGGMFVQDILFLNTAKKQEYHIFIK